jgi:uncharacterized membrane protein YjjB (DUF3815 family)
MDLNFFLSLAQDMLLASVPAVGFALLFNVPRQALVYCALGGAMGHGLRFLLMGAGMPIEWSSLAAATAISFVGVYWAQKFRAHPKVFTVAAVIPMIPGKLAFTAMLAMCVINREGMTPVLLGTMVTSLLKVVFITGALAAGLAMPGLLLYRRSPVV